MTTRIKWLIFVVLLILLMGMAPSGRILESAYAEEIAAIDAVGPAVNEKNYLSPEEYQDSTLSVKIKTGRVLNHTTYLAVYVSIADAKQMRSAMAERYGSKTSTVASVIAKRVNAVTGMNGDYFSMNQHGYLVRQGKQYRNRPDVNYDLMLIDAKGDIHIIRYPTKDAVEGFLANHPSPIINTFNFGPAIIVEGQKQTEIQEVNNGRNKQAQRSAFIQTGPLKYIMVATEGPEDKGSKGLTLYEFIDFIAETFPEAKNAYNMDGGSSASIVYHNQKINSPQNPKKRQLCDILYFVTGEQP